MSMNKVGTHYVKCHPGYFVQIKAGLKPFEIRRNDRDFREGDRIILCEWDPEQGKDRSAEGYTGQSLEGDILSISPSQNGIVGPADEAIVTGFVVLGMKWKL